MLGLIRAIVPYVVRHQNVIKCGNYQCSNKECGICPYITKMCIYLKHTDESLGKRKLYSSGDHISGNIHNKKRGISLKAKSLIENIIALHSSKPKHIHIRLGKKEWKKKCDIYPNLAQVRDYIHNRRKALKENNCMSDFAQYLVTVDYEEGLTGNDELFTFGL